MTRTPLRDRSLPDYTRGEELFHMISHIVGGGFALVGGVLCIVLAALRHNPWGVVSGAVFGCSMLLLYTCSAVYHGLSPRLLGKKVMQILDHCSIFVLIAGTYTPVCLCTLRPYDPRLGWGLFAGIWAAAALGVTLNAIDLRRYAPFSMVCYLGMGWCALLAMEPLCALLPAVAIRLLLAGGIAYTLGAALYGLGRRRRWMHALFHLCVIAGSLLHTAFIAGFVV